MAILLKELTIRYSPQGNNLFQLIKDYYAIFGLWQQIGAGGQPGAASERKTEMVNDVMHQVGKMIQDRINQRVAQMPEVDMNKELKKFNHAGQMEDWSDFTASLTDIIRKSAVTDRTGDLSKIWKAASSADVSPSLWNLFGGKPPKKKPEWKQFDKPLKAPAGAASQRELPIAGSQMHLPFPKLPTPPENLPPQSTPFTSGIPKRLGANWEKVIGKYGYKWSEADNAYKNDIRGTSVQIQPNNSALATLASGKKMEFPNLGALFRAMHHKKKKRHASEPAAQVTEDDYKSLYEMLYT